jgi:hypothetical protein
VKRLVGELEVPDPLVPFEALGSARLQARRRTWRPFRSSPSLRSEPGSVVAIRFTTSATPFRRPRGLPVPARRRRSADSFHEIGVSPRGHRSLPSTPFGADNLREVPSPSATSAGRSTSPGRPARFVPPPGFLTLLTAYSLACLPDSRSGATPGVHPSESYPSTERDAFRRRIPSCRS